ncbi:MAG TPA: sulfurtransferase [Gemmatimonadales bacterium]
MTTSATGGHIDPAITDRGYARPEVLVTTHWLARHLEDPSVRVLESNEDPDLYATGHIPGALRLDWHEDLNDPLIRDYLSREQFQALLREFGIDETTTVILYGNRNNWWATYAFWVFQLFGFTGVRLLDGGRDKWIAEGRPFTTDVADFPPSDYVAEERDDARVRAFYDDVVAHSRAGALLIDVRSPDEFTGRKLHMPDYPQEGALRGGHIPGAANVPWARAANDDGTFRPVEELRAIYEREAGLTPDADVVTYCRIGERSSHTWFALTYLLGYPNVRNYDGSWTEWGNRVRAPIER